MKTTKPVKAIFATAMAVLVLSACGKADPQPGPLPLPDDQATIEEPSNDNDTDDAETSDVNADEAGYMLENFLHDWVTNPPTQQDVVLDHQNYVGEGKKFSDSEEFQEFLDNDAEGAYELIMEQLEDTAPVLANYFFYGDESVPADIKIGEVHATAAALELLYPEVLLEYLDDIEYNVEADKIVDVDDSTVTVPASAVDLYSEDETVDKLLDERVTPIDYELNYVDGEWKINSDKLVEESGLLSQ